MKKYLLAVLFSSGLSAAGQTFSDSLKTYREQYKHDFLDDERSPIKEKENLQFIQFFDADEVYRITANFMKTEEAKPFEMATMNGKTKTYVEYGTLSFSLHEKNLKLKIYQSIALMNNPEYKDHLFLPFTDLTNGEESYAGGRYIDLMMQDIHDNKFVIDFNKAYNPYCAYSSGYSCPKPPEENNLPVKILAGEKKYAKAGH